MIGALCVVGATTQVVASASTAASDHSDRGGACHLGNGIKHVIQIGFDNVHFFRDNPNVPSDLELMPNLLNFFESNGTFLSNSHTPLIAHTATDLLTTATGLYGDRMGPSSNNSYQAYNADGTTRPGHGVHLLDRPDRRHGQDGQRGPRHQPHPGVLAGAARHRVLARRADNHRAGAVGALHQGWLQRRRGRDGQPWSSRTPPSDIPKVFRAQLA